MIQGGAYIYLTSANIANQALNTIMNVTGVDFAYTNFVTGTWDIYASIATQNWGATMNDIQNAPGVSAVYAIPA